MKSNSHPNHIQSSRIGSILRHFPGAVLAAVLPLFCLSAQAQFWDGGAGDNLWSSVANWNNDKLPDATDTVSIGLDANVSLDFNTTNSELYLGITNSGYAGTGTLVITNGAGLACTNVFVGATNAGTLQILDGSQINSRMISIGIETNGVMTVDNGTALMQSLWLGAGSPSADGTLILTNGSVMTCVPSYYADGTCYLGETGTGTIIVDNSTIYLTNSAVLVGDNDGSSGSLILKHGAVVNALYEGFYVGRNGSGNLSLDASTLNGNYCGIDLGIGSGTGQLLLTNSSELSCEYFTAHYPSTAVVDGSRVTVSTMNQEVGSLTLQHAAVANFGQLDIGFFDTNFAGITLDDSTMIASSAVVGPYSSTNNHLLVTNGGLLLVTNASSSGTLEVRQGTLECDDGILYADNLKATTTNAVINFAGGLMNCGSANVGNSMPLVIGNETAAAEYHMLGGTHTFADGLHISANASLTGKGTISGNVTVASGGALSPGGAIGIIILSNSPTLLGTVAMDIRKTGATLTNDQLQVMAPLTYGGTLTVSNVGPDALAAGNSFQLFSASNYDGFFTSLNLPTLGSGLMWTNQLLMNGSISVVAQIHPAIHIAAPSGSNLVFTITGGSPGGAYDLLTSTNLALPLSSWTTNRSGHFDSMGNLMQTNGMSADEPHRFFLLKTQ